MEEKEYFYTLLVTYSFRSQISVRRYEISKKTLKKSFISFAALGLLSIVSVGGLALSSSMSQFQLDASMLQNGLEFALSPKADENQLTESKSQDLGGPFIQDTSEEIEQNIENLGLEELVSSLPDENVPNLWPREDKINSEFGFRRNPFGGRTYEFHEGIDIDGERGDPVVAAGRGTVIKASWQGGYGYMVEIDHGNGITTRYGHLSKIEVQVDETVSKGQLIGLVGSNGRSTGSHLHYELRVNGKAVDPRKLLPLEKTDISR